MSGERGDQEGAGGDADEAGLAPRRQPEDRGRYYHYH